MNCMSTVLLALFLCGCASAYTGPVRDRTEVVVKWDADCETMGLDGARGCATWSDTFCEIHAPKPESFLDSRALQTLGHELLHCLGAMHE